MQVCQPKHVYTRKITFIVIRSNVELRKKTFKNYSVHVSGSKLNLADIEWPLKKVKGLKKS